MTRAIPLLLLLSSMPLLLGCELGNSRPPISLLSWEIPGPLLDYRQRPRPDIPGPGASQGRVAEFIAAQEATIDDREARLDGVKSLQDQARARTNPPLAQPKTGAVS